MIFIIPATLLLGFLFYSWIQHGAKLVPWLFAFVTFMMGLDCNVRQMKATISKTKAMLVLLILTHGLLPWLTYHAGGFIFGVFS